MKILITGASGFIGSTMVEEALRRGWEVWAGVRISSSKEYLQDPRIHFIDLHYEDVLKLTKQLEEYIALHGAWDYIIHNLGVTKCLHPSDFHRVNTLYTQSLIASLLAVGGVPRKFLLISSYSAHHPNVDTLYGKSKAAAEKALQSHASFPSIVLCPTGVYGPKDKDYYLMFKTIKAGLDTVAGFTTQHLSFIYVSDLVKAAFLALESPLTNKVYNVADGHEYTDKQFTQLAKQALGKKYVLRLQVPLWLLKVISIIAESWGRMTGKPSTLNRDKYKIMRERDWRCDASPLQRDLGFTADYDLRRGIEASVAWYRAKKWL
jgi:nucleoside-diphosphate-sugar epimerase